MVKCVPCVFLIHSFRLLQSLVSKGQQDEQTNLLSSHSCLFPLPSFFRFDKEDLLNESFLDDTLYKCCTLTDSSSSTWLIKLVDMIIVIIDVCPQRGRKKCSNIISVPLGCYVIINLSFLFSCTNPSPTSSIPLLPKVWKSCIKENCFPFNHSGNQRKNPTSCFLPLISFWYK